MKFLLPFYYLSFPSIFCAPRFVMGCQGSKAAGTGTVDEENKTVDKKVEEKPECGEF